MCVKEWGCEGGAVGFISLVYNTHYSTQLVNTHPEIKAASLKMTLILIPFIAFIEIVFLLISKIKWEQVFLLEEMEKKNGCIS